MSDDEYIPIKLVTSRTNFYMYKNMVLVNKNASYYGSTSVHLHYSMGHGRINNRKGQIESKD